MSHPSTPKPPADLLKRARSMPPHEVDIDDRDVPSVPGMPPASWWIFCGRYGAAAHDDAHIHSRHSVLLVCSADLNAQWTLYYADKSGRCRSCPASEGNVLYFDIWRMHALHPRATNRAGAGWIALCWEFASKARAESIRDALRAHLREE